MRAREHANRVAIRFLSGTTPADPVRDVRFDELLQSVIQTANLLRAEGIRPERHRDYLAAQRAGDLLRAVGRGDCGGRQSGELLPERFADRRHHAGGRREGADRRRSVAVCRHLAEGRGDSRGTAGAQDIPRRRQRPRPCRRDRLRGGHRRATGRQAPRPQDARARHRSGAVPHRRHDRAAEARAPHPRRADAGRLEQCR